jgi:hypothetical protein
MPDKENQCHRQTVLKSIHGKFYPLYPCQILVPHDLVAAFKSTLEETRRANVLLHIVDAADEYNLEKIEQVQDIIFG